MTEIREGMKQVAQGQVYYSIPGAGYVNTYDYVGIGRKNVAIKTGTPQASEEVVNSAVIGFYPAENPEIAFGVYLEKGDYAKILAANVMQAYVSGKISTQYDEEGVPKSIL